MKDVINFKTLAAVFAVGLLGGVAGFAVSKNFTELTDPKTAKD